jgi:ribonuclease D
MSMKIHKLITKSQELADLCARMRQADFIAIDTEFMRENSYWAQLCLIQVATSEEAAAIDPLAPGLDLHPLLAILVDNEDILKVFHAGGQDIEIIYNLTGRTPHPLFDTQVAGMALGMGEQIGYANLVEHYERVVIDKGARYTDWERRPLEPRQLDYALGDVTHLARIFPKMLEQLRTTGRGAWLNDEMERLADPDHYDNPPDIAWKRIKINSRKADVLGRLKALAEWRELEAQNRNIPRGRIMKDETLLDLVSHPPKEQVQLPKIRGIAQSWANNAIGEKLMHALAAAKPLPTDELPAHERGKPHLNREATLIADLLKLLLKIRAKEIDVAPRLLARNEELELLAGGAKQGLEMLKSWRAETFGKEAVALVEGRLFFGVENGRLIIRHADTPAINTKEPAHDTTD